MVAAQNGAKSQVTGLVGPSNSILTVVGGPPGIDLDMEPVGEADLLDVEIEALEVDLRKKMVEQREFTAKGAEALFKEKKPSLAEGFY